MSFLRQLLPEGSGTGARAIWDSPWFTTLRRQRLRQFNLLRRLTPLNRDFGVSRGKPIDRHFIEHFLAGHAADIHGRVLEIGDDRYTRMFGGHAVSQSDVLHINGGAPTTTIVADLSKADHVPSDSFDCILFTQTLMFIYEPMAAIRTLHRVLKPGGTLLMTVAGISQICRWDMDQWGDYWRFTTLSTQRLLQEAFSSEQIHVRAYGNVLAATAFLLGFSAEDLTQQELAHCDRDYQMIIAARALKSRAAE